MQEKTVTVNMTLERIWLTRYELKQTPRQALINGGSESLRVNYHLWKHKNYSREFAKHQFFVEVKNLQSLASKWDSVWVRRTTELGDEVSLSAFGKWILAIINYYSFCTDTSFDVMVNHIIEKVK